VRAGVALVPQEYAFYPSLTVAENLQFFAGIQRLARADRAERIAHALTIAGLESATARRGDALSGGMKRRLNLALGLLNRPQLLLLDEPTVGIDPQSRAFILDAITGINRSGTTVVYTSHYMEEVEAICDDIAVIDHGKLLAQGALPALLARMPHRRLRLDFAAPLTEAQHAALCAVEPLRVTANSAVADHCSADAYGQVMATVRSEHVALSRVQYGHTSLEDLFLDLTTRRLRDE
jgi:ABC-2 type transport system ATP-binding protein